MTDALWEKFCKLFQLDDLWADESLRENNNRVAARDHIMPQIRELISVFTRNELIQKLEGTGLPFAPISRPEDMFEDPHLNAGNGLEEVVLTDGTTAMLPTLPITMDGKRTSNGFAMRAAGYDTREILKELNYSDEVINTMIASKVTS